MPVDLEMFFSHTGSNLFDYPSFTSNRYSFDNNYEEDNLFRSFSLSKNHILIPNVQKKENYLGKETSHSLKSEENSKIYRKVYGFSDDSKKKKVSFADDKGFSLVEIREIPGYPAWPTNTLVPLVSDPKQILIKQKQWKLAFGQPPWTDEKLVELLERNKVALESIHVQKRIETLKNNFHFNPHVNNDAVDVLQGTIKVKNLCYEKKVFVRISFDRWQSSTDVMATYLKPEKDSQKLPNYDTFSFSVDVPPLSLKYEVIEFCVGYFCDGHKYWDNNGGVNYRLVTDIVDKNTLPVNRNFTNKTSEDKITLSLTENLENFSEINSWNNFMLNQPYW